MTFIAIWENVVGMHHLGIAVTTFFIVLLAELGDKTQLVAFSLTTTTRRPVIVFIATSAALVLSSVLAVLIGKAAAAVIPGYTAYISAGLFIIFGVYIIVSKEPNSVQEAFLNSITVEKSCIKLMEKSGGTPEAVKRKFSEICGEEYSHYQTFRLLLKEKHLFHHYIDTSGELKKVTERLKPCTYQPGQTFDEGLAQLIDREQAIIDFFQILLNHLDESHEKSDEAGHTIRRMMVEERGHKDMFLRMRERYCENS